MNRRSQLFTALLIPAILIAACNAPVGNNATQPASNDQVATVVAMTLQAITPEPETPADSLLPHTLYFLGTDAAGLTQVFRLEKDGKTLKQVTSETVNVGDFGVSPVDGSVAYVANNQLLLINEDGSNRRMLVDGGVVDENNPFLTNINNPVFSPDGQILAYGYKGLNLYAISTGASDLVIENQIDDTIGGGLLFPKELYWPEQYSPDGTKLLITLAYYEGASAAIYDTASGELVRLTAAEGALICCDAMEWSADGSSIYSASPAAGMFNSGLWKVDPSGAVTTLFTSDFDSSTFLYADEPYLAPDGQLYFFFAESTNELNSRTPLQLVRSAPDGVTGRTVLRPDTFELMNEALWAPDASFMVVVFATTSDNYQNGRAEIVYVDGRPNVVLTQFAQQMKWGP